jgi:hypothetical protein
MPSRFIVPPDGSKAYVVGHHTDLAYQTRSKSEILIMLGLSCENCFSIGICLSTNGDVEYEEVCPDCDGLGADLPPWLADTEFSEWLEETRANTGGWKSNHSYTQTYDSERPMYVRVRDRNTRIQTFETIDRLEEIRETMSDDLRTKYSTE